MKKLIFVLGLYLMLTGCDRGRVFEAYRTIDPEGWHQDSIAVFRVEPFDTINGHNVFINIRNQGDYAFSNLWLFIDIESPDGTLLTDTVEFTLADHAGKWMGSGFGNLFDNQFLYKQNVFFPKSGLYQFRVKQGMRSRKLKGIHDVGLRVEQGN